MFFLDFIKANLPMLRYVSLTVLIVTTVMGFVRWLKLRRIHKRYNIRTETLEKVAEIMTDFHLEHMMVYIQLVQLKVFNVHGYTLHFPHPLSGWNDAFARGIYSRHDMPDGYYMCWKID